MKNSLSICQIVRLLVLRYANVKVLTALAGLVFVLFLGKKLSFWFAFLHATWDYGDLQNCYKF